MADERGRIDIARLVAEHHEAVYRYAFRLCGTVADAEDLTQETFLTAQQKLGQLQRVEAARGWLLAIARNGFLKACRRRRPAPATSLKLEIEGVAAELPTDAEIDQDRLEKALNQLPESFRVVLVMFYFEGSSYREIAEGLDLPIGTVMSRLARAKVHLRSRLFGLQRRGARREKTSSR
jgi:RNA polymerase sigma-70 factor (ECF subfamily)